jgi:hypothetical protein
VKASAPKPCWSRTNLFNAWALQAMIGESPCCLMLLEEQRVFAREVRFIANNISVVGPGADFVFAWPTARITIVGAETAASVIFAREIRESKTPEEIKNQRIEEYSNLYENPYVAAERSCVDEIIMPHDTRKMINRVLDILEDKNKDNKAFKARPFRKYSNINL